MTDTVPALEALTIEQQAQLGSGADFWTTKQLGDVPSVMLTDGPHGLRKQEASSDQLSLSGSLPSTCFPPAVALSQTWDPQSVYRIGEALGNESQALDVQVLLGPGVNIKRDPRGGRNFEYFSEDPHVAGALGTAWVDGLQSTGVGASLKHFAVNNQEWDRMRVSADVDPRPLREIYLRPFQRVVENAQPWTVMCSYNRINGVHASQNSWLLTDVLRGDWSFEGIVVSDWGAVADRVAAVAAGLDLQMPGDENGDAQVVAAVHDGTLDPALVTRNAERLERFARVADASRRPETTWNVDAHHALAREVAGKGIVLLRDDQNLLPLEPVGSIAVIGEFAAKPRYQGGGSSHVHPTRVDIPLDEIRALAGDAAVEYSSGFSSATDADAAALREDAVTVASASDVAVVFLGLFERQEAEGADRPDIELPQDQLDLLEAVTAVQPRTVVVLSHGGALRLAPITAGPASIVDGSLLGQAAGGAIADVLFGVVNPSGRLTETVPERLEDTPAFTNFPGERMHVRYGEGIYVGYRWYDARDIDVTFPFGHGLSYTSFSYESLSVETVGDEFIVTVTVQNTGERAGREIVQIYASLPGSAVARAPKWLVGFGSVDLEPGQSADVTVQIPRDELGYWDEELHGWVVEAGEYSILAAASSRDIRLQSMLAVGSDPIRYRLGSESSLGEIMRDPIAGPAFEGYFAAMFEQFSAGEDVDFTPILDSSPFGRFLGSLGGAIPAGLVEDVLRRANTANGFE
ncbi:glycoside hydrolase family 3 C-terminal domain-containing protein [Arthrobacter sp. efr-133-TYG-118]|uniref:beta-glucosidase n=1 Tax=Arthrobacter sp. efr-133-TYG-118 TaxID=3040279 RepID=UPI00254BB2ED|nr:glycoside hydrolase family 3 C-terminal domain-containing protein [Arthrobacter sp. efr-133-TYG-118]